MARSAYSVSVVIPAYNAAGSIARAVSSAMAQTRRPLEIIVVDDGSTDATGAAVRSFGAPVRLLRKANGGPASARNLGARQSIGDWIAFLDADDWWAPTKLEKQISLAGPPDVGLVHTLTNCSPPRVPRELTFDQLWRRNWIGTSTAFVRRYAFESLGGYAEDRPLVGLEDYHLWLRMLAAGWRILCYPEALSYYHRGRGISSGTQKVLDGNLENLRQIGSICGLPDEKIRDKRTWIYDAAGHAALYKREGRLARKAFRRAFSESPSPARALKFALAHVPAPLLDFRRRLLRRPKPTFTVQDMRELPSQPMLGGPDAVRVSFQRYAPYLLIVADAGENSDFHTTKGFSRAHRMFEHHGLVPTYTLDEGAAARADLPLTDYVADGKAEVGARLDGGAHPRPDRRAASPPSPVFEKLRSLTANIEKNFGSQPILFRGSHEIGDATASALDRLGYRIDCSVVPAHDFRALGGADFRKSPDTPYWFGPGNRLLEIPNTVGPAGRAGVRRSRLCPDVVPLDQAKRMTRALLRAQHRVFVVSYRAPTAGADFPDAWQGLMQWMEGYLEFFLGELGGIPATPSFIFADAAFAAHSGRIADLCPSSVRSVAEA